MSFSAPSPVSVKSNTTAFTSPFSRLASQPVRKALAAPTRAAAVSARRAFLGSAIQPARITAPKFNLQALKSLPIIRAANDIWGLLASSLGRMAPGDNPAPVGPVVTAASVKNGVPEGGSIPGAKQQDAKGPTNVVQFGAGCFWSVELAFQRVPGVIRTAVGYSQGTNKNPTYNDVCTGVTNHNEIVLVEFDPSQVTLEQLCDTFWHKHDPTTPNRAGNDVGTQYRSGIYYYTEEQKTVIEKSRDAHQKTLPRPIVTEVLPAADFYYAEEYHQQYLSEKGGRAGRAQSAAKGCNDPIRCYG
eukprot:tig00020964_g16786.t1